MGIRTLILPGIMMFLFLLLGCTAGGPPLHRSSSGTSLTDPADRKETLAQIASVVRQQLDAFKRDDYSGAYTFVSKAFRKEFPRDLFEARIRARFKEVARPAQVLFRRLHFHPGDNRAVLEVDVAGANARLATVEYRMVFEEGSWKIDGLEPLDPFRAL
ncbi:MAG: DUF4864 domain-containing protein [Candidatus Manganitrophus sp. SB1]|nr:DUF4864 domain-containing protein [Candidatus Manganitrophus morganii]